MCLLCFLYDSVCVCMGEREGEGGGQEKRRHKGGLKALENGHSVWHKHAGNS